MKVFFDDGNIVNLERKDGHLYLYFRMIQTGGNSESFILDTGAFMTVLSRNTALSYGYDKLPKIVTIIKGLTGEEPADFVRIPNLKILNITMINVPVLIPHSKRLKQNIVGLNVLEYFKYCIDTENDKMYIMLNPKPRHYHGILACEKVIVD